MRLQRVFYAFLSGAMLFGGASCSKTKCKSDEDCKSGSEVCYEGRCISLKGASGKALPSRGGRREVDPNAVFKVTVDPKKNPILGPATAPVTIVEYSDFQCPYCQRASHTMHKIVKAFPKGVRLVFKNNPLSFHKHAELAAQAAYTVFALKGDAAFWKYHDKLFANRRDLGRPNLEKWANELGVDLTKFRKALDTGTYRKIIQDQQQGVEKLGARGAPAFFINGRFVSGARPFDFFKGRVNEEIEKAQKIMSKGVKPKDLYAHIIAKGKTKAVYAK